MNYMHKRRKMSKLIIPRCIPSPKKQRNKPLRTPKKLSRSPKMVSGKKSLKRVLRRSLRNLHDSDSDSSTVNVANIPTPPVVRKRKVLPRKSKTTPSVDDSVIILSDSENERGGTQKRRKRHGSSESVSSEENSTLVRSVLRKVNSIASRGSERKNSKSQESDISCICVSDTEDGNIQNIRPLLNRTSDDVAVVWSSVGPTENPTTSQHTEISKNDLFFIDKDPQPENLIYLNPKYTDDGPRRKRIRLDYESPLYPRKGKRKFEKQKKPLKRNTVKRIPVVEEKEEEEGEEKESQSNENKSKSDSQKKSQKDQSKVEEKTVEKSTPKGELRKIVIDGMNVAMGYTNGKTFSEEGLKLVIDYFKERGHSVTAFVPQYMRSEKRPLLETLYKEEETVVFTPSRRVGGKRITSHDDNYILDYATKCKGIVISQDQYRDLYEDKPEWRDTIANRLLAPTFVQKYVMFPQDPLGRKGPNLDDFLRHEISEQQAGTTN